ncbi:MAG: hypothetical protein ACI86X_002249 [Moritella sp.]|jgi:hypothetical protein
MTPDYRKYAMTLKCWAAEGDNQMRNIILAASLTLVACSEVSDLSELGTAPFEKAKWESSITERSTMLNDLLSKYDVTKQDRAGIERLLGDSDGYYLYDEFPAYRLEPTGNCIVAFPIDRDTGKVKKVVIEPDGCADKGY